MSIQDNNAFKIEFQFGPYHPGIKLLISSELILQNIDSIIINTLSYGLKLIFHLIIIILRISHQPLFLISRLSN